MKNYKIVEIFLVFKILMNKTKHALSYITYVHASIHINHWFSCGIHDSTARFWEFHYFIHWNMVSIGILHQTIYTMCYIHLAHA